MEGAWAVLKANGSGLGGAISKWKGLGGAISKWKGSGRCYKQTEGAWAVL